MKHFSKYLLACGAAILLPGLAHAQFQNEALVEALVKKGVLTYQEAEDIKKETFDEYKSTGGGKLDINKGVSKLRLYGDFRGRYEWQETTAANSSSNTTPANNWRARIRVRVGADYDLKEGMKAGVRIATGDRGGTDADQRSTNWTLGNGFGSANIYLDKAFASIDFVKYFKGEDLWLDKIEFGGGIVDNPLVKSNLTWDSDINPNGAYATFNKKWEYDGAELTPFFTSGLFLLQDNLGAPFVAPNGENNDAWFTTYQLGLKTKLDNKDTFTIALTQYYWLNQSRNGDLTNIRATGINQGQADTIQANGRFVSGGQNTFNNTRSLNYLTGYADYRFHNLPWDDKLPLTLWTEHVYNWAAGKANYAVQAGAMFGELKKKGDYEVGAYWNFIERNSVFDAFTDSDFSNGSVNRQGYVVKAGYAFTDFATLNFTWFDVTNVSGQMATGTETGRAQLDINVKF
ncbi:MAG: putative porin [Verrucomicrobiae bacterium]|nr:putative porin [Verrucomicrobiae bacterium]